MQNFAALKKKRYIAPWLVLVACLLATGYAGFTAKSSIELEAQLQFVSVCDEIQFRTAALLEAHKQVLLSAAGLFDASERVERDEWHAYAKRMQIDQHFNGIQGLGVSLLIARDQLVQHVAEIRKQGFPEYTVRPAGVRDVYTSIVYLEPSKGRNLKAFGYDMYTEPVRRAAMEQARDQNTVALSGKVVLVQETNQKVQAGTLMYAPLYKKSMPITTVEQRRAALYGWVYSPFRMGDLLSNVIQGRDRLPASHLHLQVYDGHGLDTENLLYDNAANFGETIHAPTLFNLERHISLHGREWTLHFEIVPDGTSGLNYGKAWITLAGGLMTSLLLFLLMRSYEDTRRNAVQIATELTAELRESQQRLEFILQRSHTGVWDLDLVNHIAYRSLEHAHIFGYESNQTQWNYEMFLDHVLPDDRSRVGRNMRDATVTQTDWQLECRIRRVDGKVRWIGVAGGFPRDSKGEVRRMSGIVRDITDRKLAEEKNLRLTGLYAALSQCNGAIVRSASEEELFPEICRTAVQFGGMKMAWIGFVDEASQLVMPVASYGEGVEFLKGIQISTSADDPTGRGPTGIAIRENQPFWCNDFMHNTATIPWHERGACFGWGSSASLPLHRNGIASGALTLYSGEINAFDEAERNLLVEMAIDIDYALQNYAHEAERNRAAETLREKKQHLQAIFDAVPECVRVIDRDGQLLEINAAGLAMLEADSVDLVRRHTFMSFILPEYRAPFAALKKRAMAGENETMEFEITGLKGTRLWLDIHAVPMRDASGKVTKLLSVSRDITQRKLSVEHIQRLAHFDMLTGLPNRVLLADRINHDLSMAQRNHTQLAVLLIDLDHFKNVNDTLGHSIGDELLRRVAERLKAAVREEDTVSRLGGDEFLIVLPCTDIDGAAHVAEKLMGTIVKIYRVEQFELTITPSIGIAMYPGNGDNFDTLARCADIAMYRAKHEGRNNYRFFTPEMQVHSARTLQVENGLRQALECDQLQLYYQPQISLHDERIIGVEALLRWHHPELGLISPAEFIPIAETSGQIVKIGEWVLRTAINQLKNWLDRGLTPMIIAVNLSAVQFRQTRLPQLISQILAEFQLPPQYLELELTEGVALDNPHGAIAIMNELHEHGIRMSIDDFGTGYSSLSYLKKFRVYKLKIDQSFVRNISNNQEDKAIVTSIISLAKSLGLQTIAEGVETEEQLAFLRENGCNDVQGYYFSEPLTAEQLEEYVLSKN